MRDYKLKPEVERELCDKYIADSNISFSKLSREYGVCIASIHNILNRHNIKPRTIKKITSKQRGEIIELYKNGDNSYDIANKYGVDASSVQRMLRRNKIQMRQRGDYRIHPLNEHYFDTIDSPDKAYFLGLLYSDGCNSFADTDGKKRYNIILQMSGDDELELLTSFRKYIGSDAPITHPYIKSALKPVHRLSLYSKHMASQLVKIGVTPRKSNTALFPKWMDEKLLPHFIRGIVDGDGSITKQSRGAQLCITGTADICESIMEIIPSTNVRNIYVYRDDRSSNCFKLSITTYDDLIWVCDWLYKDSTPDTRLERKYESYCNIKSYWK